MRVGVIPDTHFPAVHPGALAFVLDTFSAWDVQQVVHIGDVSDLHNPSFHDKHPDMPGSRDEFDAAYEMLHEWNDALVDAGFVTARRLLCACEGNHDDRPKRVAAKFGVTTKFVVDHAEAWNVKWRWALEHIIDDVLYIHGHRRCGGGQHPAHLTLKKGMDTKGLVMGHYHTRGGVNALPGRRMCRWGMDVGCLVDRLHPAMQYAEGGAEKQMMSLGVIIDGHPYYEMMPCGHGEPYNRSKFK